MMRRFVATFHHAELPPVHWYLVSSSAVAAQMEAWSLQHLLAGCTHVTIDLGPAVTP